MQFYEEYLYEPFLEMMRYQIKVGRARFSRENAPDKNKETWITNPGDAYIFGACDRYERYEGIVEGRVVPRFEMILRFPLVVERRFEDFYDLQNLPYRKRLRVRRRFKMEVESRQEKMYDRICKYFPERLLFIFDMLGYDRKYLLDLRWTCRYQHNEWKHIMDGDYMPSLKALCIMAQCLEITLETLLGTDEWVYPWEI